ncbi:MAG: Na(+)-translocating NADH-quinone reductase subunit C [Xanthomonadales bacterium]|nr:Na(+)-translocating NADH-quinone reductase subunit C [Gammaproteobacteria bacterium]MBT8055179.1 Na(+)-translocating NADH-quinone reductase subunit C [Gammaproteobacteria bacterium]NND55825.1 Na(+)-translocating NADH-quinone reductase subunit C [Xanthomonadales bacterium]NNK51368.1 Na(+)-translocating NADH-quinone reductase subunit C [Xanthomonadales bacterium]
MTNDSPVKAFLVVLLTAVICSSLVSAAVVILRPIQLNNQMLDRSRNIIKLTGLVEKGVTPSDEEMLELYRGMDVKVVDIDRAAFTDELDPLSFDQRRAVNNAELGIAIPSDLDAASLGRRSRFATVYMVLEDGELDRLILPVRGTGMWSMMYGYVALESDLNTIAAATFYEQNETPGLGDQIMRPDWQAQWKGRRVYDEAGDFRFAVNHGKVEPGSSTWLYEVDALTGATVTADAVTAMMQYWFGPHGYRYFLEELRDQNGRVN